MWKGWLDGKGVLPVRVAVNEVAPAEIETLFATNRPRPDIAPSMRTDMVEVGAGDMLKVAVALIAVPDTNTDGRVEEGVQTMFDMTVGVMLEELSCQTGKLFVYWSWVIETAGTTTETGKLCV